MASVFLYHVVGVDVDGVRHPGLEEEIIGSSSCGGNNEMRQHRTGSVGEVSGGEVALDVDETIFVAMAEDVDEMTKLTLTRWSADWRGATELYEQAGQSGKYERAKVALEKASKGQEMQASYPSIPLLR
ncbi:hypothetical protein Bca101_066891 [Brassica carinata]